MPAIAFAATAAFGVPPALPGGALAALPTRAQLRPITRGETRGPEVAITFDACATPKGRYGFDRGVFEILERERIPATIFVSGLWVDTHPEAMADLARDPLIEFGDHSYDHPHMTRLSPARVAEEIDQTEAALGRYGRRGVAFRPPFGEWNRRLLAAVGERRLATVTWDVVSGDPSARTTTEGMIRAVVGQTRAGSIIVFHINGRGWKTHEALPAILQGLAGRGFRFVQISELLEIDRPAMTSAPPSSPASASAPTPTSTSTSRSPRP